MHSTTHTALGWRYSSPVCAHELQRLGDPLLLGLHFPVKPGVAVCFGRLKVDEAHSSCVVTSSADIPQLCIHMHNAGSMERAISLLDG